MSSWITSALIVLMLGGSVFAVESSPVEIDWAFGCDASGSCSGNGRVSLNENGTATATVQVENDLVVSRGEDSSTSREVSSFSIELDGSMLSLLKNSPVQVSDLNAIAPDGNELHQLIGPMGEVLTNFTYEGDCTDLRVSMRNLGTSGDREPHSSFSSSLSLDATSSGNCDTSPTPAFFGELFAAYARMCTKVHQAQMNQCATSCRNLCGDNGVKDYNYEGGECGTGGRCECNCNPPKPKKPNPTDPETPGL